MFRAWDFDQHGHETSPICTWLAKGKIEGLGPGGLIDYPENVAHLVVYSVLGGLIDYPENVAHLVVYSVLV